MNRENKSLKGFTLAELLIVVAIIGVLVCIAIPVFSSQLEKSREATDLANVRSAYAQVMEAANMDDKSSPLYDELNNEYNTSVKLIQKKEGWTTEKNLGVGGITILDRAHWKNNPKPDGTCIVSFDRLNQEVTLTWSGLTIKRGYHWNIDNGSLSIQQGSGNWYSSAITDTLYAKNGESQKLTLGKIPQESTEVLKGISQGYAYQVGFFILDEDNKIIVDSGRYSFSQKEDVDFSLNASEYIDKNMPYDNKPQYLYSSTSVADGTPVKIAVQVFKVSNNGSGTKAVEITDAEARELEKLISIQTKK